MKAKSRKRLLISSVAMLLVAMLALGTATFAWFTTDTRVTANNINVSTTKSSLLKISRYDLEWTDTTLDYHFNGAQLRPASSSNGSNWFTASAESKTAYAKASTANFTPLTSDDIAPAVYDSGTETTSLPGYVLKDMINIKNFGAAGTADITDIKIKFNADGWTSPLARIAVVKTANQTTGGIANIPAMTETFQNKIWGLGPAAATVNKYTSSGTVTTVNKWYPVSSATDVNETQYAVQGAIDDLEIPVGTLSAGSQASYMILIWFEGQDEGLYDDTNAALTTGSLTFEVSGSM